jgi:predicted RNA binding protein YcfA (HicA-like mRNA interferase family)
MSGKKDMQQLAKKAERQGWTIVITGGSHMKWTSPAGEKVFSSYSPSDHRAIHNTIKELRKRGFEPR